MNGIVIVDKPAGWTSQDVTARLRRVFGTRRIGHGGTLDPMATGVLPVFVGRATRGVEFFEHARKGYAATLRLGLLTDTEDTTGTVLERRTVQASDEALEAALALFRGEIAQVPPMYSALKVNGQKLCDLARKGREVERQARNVTIYRLEATGRQGDDVYLDVECSKGTYIRTLCKDIGEALGCGGCMAALRRTRAGAFTLADAVPLQTLLDSPDPGQYLRGVDTLFSDRPKLTLSPAQARAVRNGAAFPIPTEASGEYRLYSAEGEFLALARAENGRMATVKSFFEPEMG